MKEKRGSNTFSCGRNANFVIGNAKVSHPFNRVGNAPRFVFQISNFK